ncbi:SLC26A/SulP transporter domain [Phytophthora cactorum]|nr:SLC26A/SulP transporter domain [Phytophthora cactorum]
MASVAQGQGLSRLSRLSQLSAASTTRAKSRKTNVESPTHMLLYSPTGNMSNVRKQSSQKLAHITNAVMYGIINSILAIPAIYGYTVIIFSHRDYQDFMPALSKLVVYSSVVHQIMFTLMSSMPFSIGQVQDGGLIFLSTMASSICNSLGDNVPLEAKVTTSVVTIAIATTLFGVCLVVMGKMKLAELASYLPIPVIGGNLAFIGIFCLYAGLALCTGLIVNDVESMISVFDNPHDILLCVPGVLAIISMPVVFFFILLVGGISMDDARDGGWIDPATDPATVTDLINLFDFSLVHWRKLPKQFGTWIGMVFIVAFGSCLDIAAIELDMDKKLDFNQELNTVGWSNVVSGLLGGCTGSYIFSQTIFTYRSKTNSRIVGVCVIIAESAIVVAPVSVMSYVPRFFFAATLIFIAIDLMVEWLVLARKQMSLREYASNAIAYFELSGFLFFGSSVQILDRVQKAVVLLLTPDENRTPLIECLVGTPATSPDTVPTEHVVMDFTDVTAVDSTVVRSAFHILQKNNIVGEESFPSASSALGFCETQVLSSSDISVEILSCSHNGEPSSPAVG